MGRTGFTEGSDRDELGRGPGPGLARRRGGETNLEIEDGIKGEMAMAREYWMKFYRINHPSSVWLTSTANGGARALPTAAPSATASTPAATLPIK